MSSLRNVLVKSKRKLERPRISLTLRQKKLLKEGWPGFITVFHEVHNPGLNMNVGKVRVKTKNNITKRYHAK